MLKQTRALRGGDRPLSKSIGLINLDKIINIYIMVLVKLLYLKNFTKRSIITERSEESILEPFLFKRRILHDTGIIHE